MMEKKAEWIRDREFKQDGIVLTVWKLPLRWPRYRFDIGCEGKEGKTFRSFLVRLEGQGKVSLSHKFQLNVVEALVREAEEYILGEAQSREDNRVDRMMNYESKDLARDRPKQRPGIKTLGKIDGVLKRARDRGR